MNDNLPILVGNGQYTQRDVEPAEARSPLDMMVECARRASADAGPGAGLLARVDLVGVINILSWPYANAPGALAARLGCQAARQVYTTIGGNSPQSLVNATAERIARGEVRLALLAGAEAVNTVRRAQKAKIVLPWPSDGDGKPETYGDRRLGTNELEGTYGLQLPVQIYPLFENALRRHYGRSIPEHRRALGELCARFSAVAAENPHAWFRERRSAEEVATVSADNRYIAFPYPKYMNAIMDVDQAAAVLMTSVGTARALGIPESRWVYLSGCGDAHDNWFVTDRVNYFSSPAIRRAGHTALEMAGAGISDIAHLDLYSCFPSAVQIGRDALGIAADDPRPLTCTGGLPYFGGPGNNYSMHGIAAVMDRVRAQPGSKGLVTALGWYITKHSVGIYTTEPPAGAWQRRDPALDQAEVDARRGPEVVREPDGSAEIETYTVFFDRDGSPVRGIVIGRLDEGRRFLAELPADRALLESLTKEEAIGRRGVVRTAGGASRMDL